MLQDGNKIVIHCRWMISDDMPHVLEIEKSNFGGNWSEEQFIERLKVRNCIGMVAEYEDKVVAFMLYGLNKHHLNVINFCVHNNYRRSGVGGQMMQKLIGKLSTDRRNRILTDVRETNMDGLLFLKSQGLDCVDILRNHYEDEDGYLMEYKYFNPGFHPKNRISQILNNI